MACMARAAFVASALLLVSSAHGGETDGSSYACPLRAPASVSPSSDAYGRMPSVDGAVKFIGGIRSPFGGKSVDVTSPIYDEKTGERAVIGKLAQLDEEDAIAAVNAAAAAWDRGQGKWPQMSLAGRIAAVEALIVELTKKREEIVELLMWEICKTTSDAAKEFDRTIEFVRAAISEVRKDPSMCSGLAEWTELSGTRARARRGPVGVLLGLAPFNYPLNEMYAMLMPALIMGNTAVIKLPATGGLVHILTAEAFAKALPPGVVNFVSGSGRKTMPPIMRSGLVDVLGFIGGTSAMDAVVKEHPEPHRLKVFAQLAGKNMGIVLPDADLDVAVQQVTLGATSYNGQRCTAIKLIMVHDSIADAFVARLVESVGALKAGLPWEPNVAITPLPEPGKPKYLEELIGDALGKGARLANAERGGGELAGALMTPAIVDAVTPKMRLFHEEQFGPVIPVARYSDVAEVHAALKASWNGQQASIFTADPKAAGPLVDALSSTVGRINFNAQCGRGPDMVPFAGRRSSAMGTMSISEALRAFSIETVIAHPAADKAATALADQLERHSSFLAPL